MIKTLGLVLRVGVKVVSGHSVTIFVCFQSGGTSLTLSDTFFLTISAWLVGDQQQAHLKLRRCGSTSEIMAAD